MAYNERELLAKHKLLLYADAISANNIDLRGVEIGAKDELFAALGVTDYGDKTRFTSLLKELTGNIFLFIFYILYLYTTSRCSLYHMAICDNFLVLC